MRRLVQIGKTAWLRLALYPMSASPRYSVLREVQVPRPDADLSQTIPAPCKATSATPRLEWIQPYFRFCSAFFRFFGAKYTQYNMGKF